MIPTATLIAVTIFTNQFQCLSFLVGQLINRPEYTNISYLNTDDFNKASAFLELHGAYAILQCEGEMYTAYVLEDKYEED